MVKKKVGRPSKLTPEVKARLIEAFEKGAYDDDACHYAGIHKSTFYRWIERGNMEAKGEYRDFCDAVECSQAEGIIIDLSAIVSAVKAGDWRAAAWKLEHKEPTKYGNRERLDITKHGDADIGQLVIADKELSKLWTETLRHVKRSANKSTRVSDSD